MRMLKTMTMRMAMTIILTNSTLGLAAGMPHSDAKLYQVDLVVFKILPGQTQTKLSNETWPYYAAITIPSQAQKLQLAPQPDEGEDETENETNSSDEAITNTQADDPISTPTPFTQLQESKMLLLNQARRINKSAHYQVLWHNSWYQPLASALTHTILISNLNNGQYPQLTGTININKKRYYNITLNLELHDYINGHGHGHELRYRLIEKRKIHDQKLHYFDHPKLAALMIIKPVEPSENDVQTAPLS